LPSSNAFVERVFSQVTCMKTKSRNRLATATLDAILMIKFYLLSQCCVAMFDSLQIPIN